MVSKMNNKDTLAYFEEHHYFGLSQSQVHFFLQGYVPCTDENGKLVLYSPYQVSCGSTLPPLVVYFS